MLTKVRSSNILDVLDEVRPLPSVSGQVATPEQKIDLLGFWEVGQERFENHIKFYALLGGPMAALALLLMGIPLLATNNTYHLLDVSEFGWKVVDDCLMTDWDDPKNFEKVKECASFVVCVCGCKKGCNTKRCSCFKAGLNCGAGCRCANCQNFPSSRSQSSQLDDNEVEQEELRDDRSVR